MSEKRQKIYMQLRLVRLAAQQWQVSIQKASKIFQQYHVFHYIADNYDLFHMWGDLAIFEDIKEYIHNKGAESWLYNFEME